MGNNKKTVKCGFCGRMGHNRVSCQKLKDLIEKEREKYGSSHPDVKTYDSLTKRYSIKSSNNASSTRHCKYCYLPNHNIRSCKERAKNISELKKRNYHWRKSLIGHFKEKGIGTGCILTSKYSKKFGSRLLEKGDKWILTSIDWDKITFDDYDSNPNSFHEECRVFKLINLSNSEVTTMISVSQLVATNASNKNPEFLWDVLAPSQVLDFPEGWDTIADKKYDLHLNDLFKYLNRSTYQNLIQFSFSHKPHLILKRSEDLLSESLGESFEGQKE